MEDVGRIMEDVDCRIMEDVFAKKSKAKEKHKHKYDHLRTGGPTLITADGKKEVLPPGFKVSDAGVIDDKTIKTKINKSLNHLVKMVKGCYASPMASDSDYIKFCEDSIESLIQKTTEKLHKIRGEKGFKSKFESKTVFTKLTEASDKDHNNPLRSDERVLDYMELMRDPSVSKEDKEELGKMIFNSGMIKEADTDHFYRYFIDEMTLSGYGSKEFKDFVDNANLQNNHLEKLKNILEQDKIKAEEAALKALKEKKKAREAARTEEPKKKSLKEFIMKKNGEDLYSLKKKVTKKKVTKKASKKKVAKKKEMIIAR